jgi:hypothetical protein
VVFVFLQSYKKQALLLFLVLTINLSYLNNFEHPGYVIAVCMIALLMIQIITMLKVEKAVTEKYLDKLD